MTWRSDEKKRRERELYEAEMARQRGRGESPTPIPPIAERPVEERGHETVTPVEEEGDLNFADTREPPPPPPPPDPPLETAGQPDDEPELTIQQRFEIFHEVNPFVYTELVKLARRAKQRGQRKLGIEMLFAIVRWRRMMETKDPSGFKLNDHYTSRYARLIMEQEPDLDGLFDVRALKAP